MSVFIFFCISLFPGNINRAYLIFNLKKQRKSNVYEKV